MEEKEQSQPSCLSELSHLRWRVLIFCCFLTFGSYYVYDFPGSIGTGKHDTIQAKFHAKGKEYTQTMNQALYSVYSYPNTVLAIFGGLLIDKVLGLRKAMILFTTLVMLGTALFYIGVITTTYWLLVLARVIYGLGGESLCVSQSAAVARWFVTGGRGMALAFGITVSFSRVGSSFNFFFSPSIAEHNGVDTAIFCGLVACLVSYGSCFALVLLDIYGSKKGIVPPETVGKSDSEFRLNDIWKFPAKFWVASWICVLAYSAIYPFIGVAKNYFEVKYDMKSNEAAKFVSLYQFSSAGISPVVGAVVDAVGRFTIFHNIACVMFILVHITVLLTSIPPAVIMPTMGLGYAFLVSSLWPAVPFLVDKNLVGLAYGTMTGLQNIGLATFPLMVGAALDHFTPASNCTTNTTNLTTLAPKMLQYFIGNGTVAPDDDDECPQPLPTMEGFHWASGILLIIAGGAFLLAVTLFIMDQRGSGILFATTEERKRMVEEQKKLLQTEDGLEKPTDS